MAASIYAATRILGVPASVKEVANTLGTSVRKVMRSYWALRQYLNFRAGPITPDKYVAVICDALSLGDDVAGEGPPHNKGCRCWDLWT